MRKWLRLLVFNCQAINRSVECSKLSRVFVTNCFHGRPPYVTVLHCVTALRKKVHAFIMHFAIEKKHEKQKQKQKETPTIQPVFTTAPIHLHTNTADFHLHM